MDEKKDEKKHEKTVYRRVEYEFDNRKYRFEIYRYTVTEIIYTIEICNVSSLPPSRYFSFTKYSPCLSIHILKPLTGERLDIYVVYEEFRGRVSVDATSITDPRTVGKIYKEIDWYRVRIEPDYEIHEKMIEFIEALASHMPPELSSKIKRHLKMLGIEL